MKIASALTLFVGLVAAQETDTSKAAAKPKTAAVKAKPAATPSQPCLYCRRMDKNAGFLVSYSYCQQTDDCLMDAWNYINRPCKDEWKRGNTYELSACTAETKAKIGDVITFESGEQKITIYNGAQSGPITILISFSGAAALAGTMLAAAGMSTAMLF